MAGTEKSCGIDLAGTPYRNESHQKPSPVQEEHDESSRGFRRLA